MKKPVVIVGLGEMGGVFARGFLRLGHPVYPVTRETAMATLAAELEAPELVLVAVAENDLHPVLEALPHEWRGRVALLQNELLPADWERHGYRNPTVISVWFEKKRGQDAKVIVPSPAFGPGAGLLADALGAIGIPVTQLDDAGQLLFELVRKNVYILTTNIAGLETGGTVGELWARHRELAAGIAAEIVALQERLAEQRFDRDALIHAMVDAFEGDPAHRCMGRSAPARLRRARELAARHRLETPRLDAIAAQALSA